MNIRLDYPLGTSSWPAWCTITTDENDATLRLPPVGNLERSEPIHANYSLRQLYSRICDGIRADCDLAQVADRIALTLLHRTDLRIPILADTTAVQEGYQRAYGPRH